MSEKVKVWIARDFPMDNEELGSIAIFFNKPSFFEGSQSFAGAAWSYLPKQKFRRVVSGQCFEAEIILGEKL